MKSPINGKRCGSTVTFRLRLSTACPITDREVMIAISVVACELEAPSVWLSALRPGRSGTFCSTCTNAVAW